MRERWRIAHRYTLESRRLAEIREGGPEGGSRFVCEATPEDAEHIVNLHNAALAARATDRTEAERLRNAVRAFLAVAWNCPIGDRGSCAIDANDISALESALAAAPAEGRGEP